MSKRIDLTGTKMGRWTIIEYVGGPKRMWLCRCECGGERAVRGTVLRKGTSKSCGCYRREKGIERGFASRKHGGYAGGRATPEYQAWAAMKHRCTNPNNRGWKNYGGRGISVCDRWMESFENFLADMGPRPSDRHSIDRINNDGNYEPENCRWATWVEQNNNNRNKQRNPSKRKFIEFGGERRWLQEWLEETGVPYSTYRGRRRSGWSEPESLGLVERNRH